MKRLIVDLVHEALKRPKLEVVLQEAYRRAPRGARTHLRKLAPQPDTYLPDELRRVARGGMQWHLHPYAHFQWLQYFGFEDPVLEVLMGLARQSQLIFDVGANVGFYSLMMARVAPPPGRVHSFEPNPETLALLTRHRDENRVENCDVYTVALGDRPEHRTLFAGRDLGKFSLVAAPSRTLDGAKDVEVTTMDAFVRDQGFGRVDLVKIDVEGHEPAVIMGGRETIERDVPHLVFELTPLWYDKDGSSANEAFRWLASQPYEFYQIAQPEQAGPRLARIDLLDALTRQGGPKQLNIAGLSKNRGALSTLLAEINAMPAGHPWRVLDGRRS